MDNPDKDPIDNLRETRRSARFSPMYLHRRLDRVESIFRY